MGSNQEEGAEGARGSQSTNDGQSTNNATDKSMQFNRSHFNGNVFFGSSREEYLSKSNEQFEALEKVLPKIQFWLLGNQTNERYDNFIRERLHKTCDWILDKEKFKNWRSSSSSSSKLLWIHGPSSFGKTILCARIVQYITRPEDAVAHYFFSSGLESHKDPMVAMQSWIYQMALENDSVAHIVNKARENGPASQTAIIKLFRQAIKMVSQCTLVIDGLDKCAPSSSCLSVTEFIEEVNKAVHGTNTKILVMSRHNSDIHQALMKLNSAEFSEYEVRENDIRADIETFARSIAAQKLQGESQSNQDEMTKKLIAQSECRFLWLKNQQDSLPEGLSRKGLQDALGEIPAGLSELYSKDWQTITKGKDKNIAVLLLRLAVFSLRPLTVREISEAVLVSDEFCKAPASRLLDQWDKTNINEKIRGLCCSFLEFRQQSPESPIEQWTMHVAHSTVREFYLRVITQQDSELVQSDQSDRIRIAAEHNFVAELCIKHMNNPVAGQDATGDVASSSSSFTKYAIEFWNKHAEAGSIQRQISIENFFDELSPSWVVWRNWFDSNKGGWVNAKSDRDPAILLPYAIELGFVDLAMDIIKKGEKRVNYSSSSRTALGVACSKGYENLARELLAHGAKVGIRDAHGRTAVYYAAMNGHSELVKLLIENGANINIQDDDGVSPFLAASSNGHLDTMRRLIQKGTNVHQLDNQGNGALFKASSNGHLNAARFLIEKGVHLQLSSYTTPPVFEALRNGSFHLARLLIDEETNLNGTSGMQRPTILHVAISEGRTDVVKLLINRRVDFTQQDAEGRTPLFIACLHGHIEIVRLLLIMDEVNVTIPNKEGKTPLYAACANSHLNVADLLITHGADTGGSGTEKYAPLFGAAFGGSLAIVQLLTNAIGKAAEVSIAIRNSAILAASEGGHIKILKWLIEWIGHEIDNLKYEWTVAQTTVKCKILDMALLLASGLGHAQVVEELLHTGANPNHSGPQYQTPLYAACCNGHLEVAKLLIEKQAVIKAPAEEGQTPLMAACANGSLDLVKLLLGEGANVNTLNESGMGAAFAAAQCGHLEVLRLLHERGANIFCKNKKGMLPIHAASQNGHTKIVGFLIESGSDVKVANVDDETPLWLASLNGHVEVVGVLLKHGVDVDAKDSKGRASLLTASSQGDTELAKLLLENCANISIKDGKGQTPLYCASANGHLDVVKLLLCHGADMTPNNDGQTPAYVASSKGHVNILQLLIDSGADITQIYTLGRTLLHASCFSGHIDTTRLLLEMGADINACDSKGFKPLYSASENGHVAIVEYLTEKGATSFTKNDKGWNLVTHAASKNHKTTLKFLIEQKKENKDEADSNGITPLIAACQAGHTRIVRYLTKLNVKVETIANGTTALQAAASKGYIDVVKLLQEQIAKMSLKRKAETTPTKAAAENGHIETSKGLNPHDAEGNEKNNLEEEVRECNSMWGILTGT